MYLKMQRYPDAEAALLEAYEGFTRAFGDAHADTREAIELLVKLYEAMETPAAAQKWRAKSNGGS
jgi:hypothetical protein